MDGSDTADTLEQAQAEVPASDTTAPSPAPEENAPVEQPVVEEEKSLPKTEPTVDWEPRFKGLQREHTRVSQNLAQERRSRSEVEARLEVLSQALQEQLGWTEEDLKAQADHISARLKTQQEAEATEQAQQARLVDVATRFQSEVSTTARELLDMGAIKEAVKLEASLLAQDYETAAMLLAKEHDIDIGSDLRVPEGASPADQMAVWAKALERFSASARKVTQKVAIKATESKWEPRLKALEDQFKELQEQNAALEAQARAVSTSTGGGLRDPDAELWLRYGRGEQLSPDEHKRVQVYARRTGLM